MSRSTKHATTRTRLLTIPEAAEQLGVHKATVYRLISTGAIDATDIATVIGTRSKTRITEDSLARFIDGRTRNASQLRHPQTAS